MVQHINLLTRRQTTKRFLPLTLSGLGLLILVLVALAGKAEWQLQQQRQLEEKTQQSINDLKSILDKKRQILGLAESEALGRQVALLRSQIDAKREWNDLLQKGELGSPSGYSQWLETLAGVHVEGVWLQGLDIGKGGQSVSVQGKSLSADAVMRYIEQVNEAFKPMNVRFTSMEIVQDAVAEQGAGRQVPTLSFKIQ
jgi:hypothetical protein